MARFIVSRSKIINQINELNSLFDRVAYSYKTNPVIGDWIINNTNLPISINSFNTFTKLKNYSDRIIYFMQGEWKKEVEEIIGAGVREFVVDNENDLETLLSVSEDIHVFIRVKMREHTVYTGKYFVYGFDHEKVRELFERLDGIELSIHFHRKTQNISEWYLVEEFSDLKDIIKQAKYINIGGGLPWKYRSSSPNMDFIKNQILKFKKWINDLGTKLMAEPGRFIAGPSVKLEATVRNVYGRNVILDCSIFNAYMDTFLFNLRLEVEGEGDGNDYLLKGCTPDSLDIFRYSVKLPELKRGDKIVFLNAGAYNFHTDFNDLDKIPYVWED